MYYEPLVTTTPTNSAKPPPPLPYKAAGPRPTVCGQPRAQPRGKWIMQEIFLVSTTLVRYHVTVQSVGMVDSAQDTDCICGFSQNTRWTRTIYKYFPYNESLSDIHENDLCLRADSDTSLYGHPDLPRGYPKPPHAWEALWGL